jgi:hypothetical protein
MSTSGPAWPWQNDLHLVELEPTRETTIDGRGTIVRYRAITSDDIEREVIHGIAGNGDDRRRSSTPLTIASSPPLSLGPEGMIMHSLLHSMQLGLDGIVFGPERSRRDIQSTIAERRQIADRLSFPATAEAHHLIADELAQRTGVDLGHMLWRGTSLGAMKGMHFAARAAHYGRTMVYSQFVVPVCPNPMPKPSEAQLRRFMFTELGATFRAAQELVWKDVRSRTTGIHRDITRLVRPGLLPRYLRSAPRDSVFRMFTSAWRDQVVTGDAGIAASLLPRERLATVELFDRDEGSPPLEWRARLADQLEAGTTRMIVKSGRHTDAVRLSHQKRRAGEVKAVLAQLDRGVPIGELTHPHDHAD